MSADAPVDVPDEGVARSCKILLDSLKASHGSIANSSSSDEEAGQGWAHYPHPFRGLEGLSHDAWEFDDADLPRALVELRMCAMSNEIREKERWWEKMNDEKILRKWREEVKTHEEAEENAKWKLTDKMVRPLAVFALGPH